MFVAELASPTTVGQLPRRVKRVARPVNEDRDFFYPRLKVTRLALTEPLGRVRGDVSGQRRECIRALWPEITIAHLQRIPVARRIPSSPGEAVVIQERIARDVIVSFRKLRYLILDLLTIVAI